jgi:hypothetical protein
MNEPNGAGWVDVLLDERQRPARRLDALDICDRAADVAGEAIEPPARDAVGLAPLHARHALLQAGSVLRAAGLVLIDVPRDDLDATVVRPPLDRLALDGGRDVAGAVASHPARDANVAVHAPWCGPSMVLGPGGHQQKAPTCI